MFWNLYNFVIWNVDYVRIVFSLFYQLFPFFSFDGAWWIAMIMCVFMLHNFDWMFFFSDLELFENILVEQFLPVLGPPNPLPGHCLFRGLPPTCTIRFHVGWREWRPNLTWRRPRTALNVCRRAQPKTLVPAARWHHLLKCTGKL